MPDDREHRQEHAGDDEPDDRSEEDDQRCPIHDIEA